LTWIGAAKSIGWHSPDSLNRLPSPIADAPPCKAAQTFLRPGTFPSGGGIAAASDTRESSFAFLLGICGAFLGGSLVLDQLLFENTPLDRSRNYGIILISTFPSLDSPFTSP
jgi:hypothetical protein